MFTGRFPLKSLIPSDSKIKPDIQSFPNFSLYGISLQITYSLLHSILSLNNGWVVYILGHVTSGNINKIAIEGCAH